MGETQRRQQRNAGAGMCLDSEGDDTARRQHAGDVDKNRSKLIDVDEHIGREDQVVFAISGDLIGQKRRQIADDEPIVVAFCFGARNHRCREIDADTQ